MDEVGGVGERGGLVERKRNNFDVAKIFDASGFSRYGFSSVPFTHQIFVYLTLFTIKYSDIKLDGARSSAFATFVSVH